MEADRKQCMENVKCEICGSDDYKIVHKARYGDETQDDLVEKYRSSGDETLIDQIVKCKNCGFMYVNPRVKAELIFEGYSGGEDPTFVSQARGRELTFAKSLKLIEKHAKKGKIYDVGTAGGSFLHVARKNGWEVYGCEPNKWMCSWAKKHYGLDITPGDLFTKKYPDNYFDVLTLWDVLEHVPNPKETLVECNRILKKGGLLVVNYPDIASGISRLMSRKWVFLLSVHLFYFTPKTVRMILDKTGFETLLIKKHFQKLALGYLTFRMKQYSNLLHKIGGKMVNLLKAGDVQVPYWLGQTLVLAKKK